MVASLYEWKILEWDDKPNTNKHFTEETTERSYWKLNGPYSF